MQVMQVMSRGRGFSAGGEGGCLHTCIGTYLVSTTVGARTHLAGQAEHRYIVGRWVGLGGYIHDRAKGVCPPISRAKYLPTYLHTVGMDVSWGCLT